MRRVCSTKRQRSKGSTLKRSNWAADRIRASAGKKLNNLAIIGGAAATLNYNAIVKLSGDPFISYLRLDRKMAPLGTPGELSLYTQIVHCGRTCGRKESMVKGLQSRSSTRASPQLMICPCHPRASSLRWT